ncbi:MAG: CbrC family protein [Planctomycetes bacterium]|nr:CbrC family protein [Planctomycetota bacterium]
MERLPQFRFHADPLRTGSVEPSNNKCVCCERSRGYIYVGPVYAEEEYASCICPWCISEGSAHARLDVSFHDESSIGGCEWDPVPQSSIEEIAFRTPGFCGWQQERWWSHCGEAACFLGRAGREELDAAGAQAIASIRESAGITSDEEWASFFDAFDKDGSPTAYLFRCIRCGVLGGYQDCD